MKDPNKRHYAVIDVYNRKLTLKYNGKIVAYSQRSLILKEVGKSIYNPVFYIPKEDIKIELNKDIQQTSYCPIKGDATYWNLEENSTPKSYFAWSYETPLSRAKKIKGYIAFNSDHITFISEPI